MSERDIFVGALTKTDSTERIKYLNEACGADAALRRRLQTLIDSHERDGSILDRSIAEQFSATPASGPWDGLSPSGSFAFDRPRAEKTTGSDDGEIDLSFLRPSEKPGMIGRMEDYEVMQVLGEGGFGIVLKAFDVNLERIVAIKVLKPSLAATSPPRKRFLREARAAAAVRHDNIVTIHAVADAPIPYLVMECVTGRSLQQKLDETGPLDVPEVLRLGLQIAKGLAASHASGLIHRDIKPSNIMLEDGSDRVKITDFGLARTADDANQTESRFVAGTPMYMAPEQALSATIDQRSDLFSLGSVLYTACCGRPPFRAPTTFAVLKRMTEDTPRPIREIIPETPDWLCAIITKLHAKDPADRYATAAELVDLLAWYLSALKVDGSLPSSAFPPNRSRWRSPKMRKLVWGMAGVSLLGIGGAVLPLLSTGTGLRSSEAISTRKLTPTKVIARIPRQGPISIPKASENMVLDRWYDILLVIPLGGAWKRTGDGLRQSPPMENTVTQIPVAISGDYQLRSSFTRASGDRSVNFYFPVGNHVGVLYLDIDRVDSLVIDGEFGAASPVKSTSRPLETGRRYEVVIGVALNGDEATLNVEIDGMPHLHWMGRRTRLPEDTSSGHFAIGSRDGDTVFHELHLRLLGGQAKVR